MTKFTLPDGDTSGAIYRYTYTDLNGSVVEYEDLRWVERRKDDA